MSTQLRPRIYWYDAARKWAVTAAPFADTRRTELFRQELRQQCRGIFNEIVRAWMVDDAHLAVAQQVLKKHYGTYDFVARERCAPPPPPPPTARARTPAYVVFCALVGCEQGISLSYADARALYRHAAARLHPDAGGSSDDMATLNVAWLSVRDELH